MAKSTSSLKTLNPLTEAETRIARCKKSKKKILNLFDLGLEYLPESLRELTWLKEINVGRNRLMALPEWISEIKGLEDLRAHSNPLKSLPESLNQLNELKGFSISETTIHADMLSCIGTLCSLRDLVMGRMGLTHLPSWIRQLKHLDSLHLYENTLTELPEWLGELSKLEILSLNDNGLRSLPASILELKSLHDLFITNNADLKIPAEITKSADPRKILSYYFRTTASDLAQPLNEFKLILVGRGLVGKTSLVHRLVRGRFKKFDRTPGINITRWSRKIDGDDLQAHIWDFGGQEIMHGTHRFFMTERALYLVLLSGREGTEDYDAEYWLSMVRSFAGDVPIIVLLNKSDDFPFELNKELLREKYGREIVFIETDSSTGTGIKALSDQICEQARKLPGLKTSWPAEWRQIKNELPAQKKSWLTFEEFRSFCHIHGITAAKDQEDLAESLHDLGLMLSYRKEEALRSFGVLNPEWVTDGIYKLLNSPQFRNAGGKFTLKLFLEVLSPNDYPPKLHPYLLALMRKFQLCHPLDDRGAQYLIPDLLTKEEPNLDFDFPPEKCLGFIFSYDTVLPEGLLPRFIVETYVHQEPKFAWRTGVVLERANCRALVRGDVLGRKISIRVAGVGHGRRELLGIVREYFDRIHRSYEKLPVTWLVPVPGHPSITVPYGELLDYEVAGDDEYKVVIDRKPVKISVKELLDGVDLPGIPRNIESDPLAMFRMIAGKISGHRSPSLFISYAHKDERYRDELRGALTAYERKQEIEVWDDTRIEPGQKWEAEILEKLERADIIVLLLSNDFIKSDYCMHKEMDRALERDTAGECAIVPIVVRSCRFDKLEVGQTQAILPKAKPIKEHKDRDAAWLEVTKQLDRVIARLKKR